MRPSNSKLWGHCVQHQRFEFSCHGCLVDTMARVVRDNEELRGIAQDALNNAKKGGGR
jgi:hypothetical protein